ncbi:MAG: DUF3991 and toprim domain-containing protein [Ruminococcus sp.]|nr:DUF3991 and toprim domain-containing protein [Ruminococcus sp.]
MIDKNLIEIASRVNLADYLIARGEHLKKVGQGYVMIEHDSLRFYENTFNWYSKGQKGNTINFLCLYYDITFSQAVNELCRFSNVTTTTSQDSKRVIAYLCKKRGLDYNLVTALIKNKYLYQDSRGNCNFVIRDWDKYPIGHEIVGTGDTRYKQITSHSGYGFYIMIGKPTDVLFFESTIDLLSCYQLYHEKFTHHVLVSMGGLNPSVIYNVLSLSDDFKIWLCVDNDKAGDNFIKRIQSAFIQSKVFRPKDFKDWNDCLRK